MRELPKITHIGFRVPLHGFDTGLREGSEPHLRVMGREVARFRLQRKHQDLGFKVA